MTAVRWAAAAGLLLGSTAVTPVPAATASVTTPLARPMLPTSVTGAAVTPKGTRTEPWTLQQVRSLAVHDSELIAVSCTGPTFCMAVGSSDPDALPSTLAEVWSGTAWRTVPTPSIPGAIRSELEAVSCVSASDCEAVGDTGSDLSTSSTLAEGWNGTSWTLQATPTIAGTPVAVLGGVSCPTATACEAVGATEPDDAHQDTLIEGWDGHDWSVQATHDPRATAFASLIGVSCTSPAACVAVGSTTRGTLAEAWDGRTWKVSPTPNVSDSVDTLYAVSCSSATVCTAVGDAFPATLAERLTGGSWSIEATPVVVAPGGVILAQVDCPTADDCTAVGSAATSGGSLTVAESWDGTAWAAQPTPDPGDTHRGSANTLYGVSCRALGACTAVGTDHGASAPPSTLDENLAGGTWAVVPTPDKGVAGDTGLDAVSCGSVASCMAVGQAEQSAFAEVWTGRTWQIEPTVSPGASSFSVLTGVSCPSAESCTAIGWTETAGNLHAPVAEQWDAGHWHLESIAGPAGAYAAELEGVSCPSTTACTAVGDASFGSEFGTHDTMALVETWDGTAWTIDTVPAPQGTVDSQLTGVSCPSAATCTAVGSSQVVHGSALVVTDAGGRWTVQPTPAVHGGDLRAVSCSSPQACTSVGTSVGAGPLIERWSGTVWTRETAAALPGSVLDAVSCTSSSSCTAVGSNSAAEPTTLAEMWRHGTWQAQVTPNPAQPGQQSVALLGVSCSSPVTCTTIGTDRNVLDTSFPVAEREGLSGS